MTKKSGGRDALNPTAAEVSDGVEKGEIPFVSKTAGHIRDPELQKLICIYEECHEEGLLEKPPLEHRSIQTAVTIEKSETLKQAVHVGNVSQMRFHRGDTRTQESYQTAIGHILNEMGKEAYTGIILADPNAPGAQNVGKTDFGLTQVLNYMANVGGDAATNIPVNRGQGVRQIETETELKDWMKDSDTHRPLILLDEVDQFLSAKYGSREAVEKMTKFIREIRKDPWNARIILIGHVEKGIEPDIRQMCNHVLAKRSKKILVIYSTHADMAKGNAKMVLRDIPPTLIRYKEHQQPVFSFDDQEAGDERPEAERIADQFIEDYHAGEKDAKRTVRASKRPQDDGKLIVDRSRLETYYNLSGGMAKSVKVIVEDRLL